MVKGLDVFTEHFRDFEDRYVLIGGTACTVLMEEAGLDFRATKDLDIVLCVEALDGEFIRAFWDFIRLGGYQNQQKSTMRKLLYRFYHPQNVSYPAMLELFSRTPDALTLPEGSHLTPIPTDEEVASLSAILLNDEYYRLIHNGKRIVDGIPIVGHEYIIPLKARAWLDLIALRKAGKDIHSNDINKHRSDVFKLYQLLSPETRVPLPPVVREDLWRFLALAEEQHAVNLNNIGLQHTSMAAVCGIIRVIYGNTDNDTYVLRVDE